MRIRVHDVDDDKRRKENLMTDEESTEVVSGRSLHSNSCSHHPETSQAKRRAGIGQRHRVEGRTWTINCQSGLRARE